MVEAGRAAVGAVGAPYPATAHPVAVAHAVVEASISAGCPPLVVEGAAVDAAAEGVGAPL